MGAWVWKSPNRQTQSLEILRRDRNKNLAAMFPHFCRKPFAQRRNCPYPGNMQDVLAVLFQHAATTAGVTVRVAVTFMPDPSRFEARRWFWTYHIRLENGRDDTVQLLTRHWRITDSRGIVNLVDGEGVVGETPILAPGATHDYVSGCELLTNMGSMEGSYVFEREDGSRFEVAIPFFPLAAPAIPD